MRQTLIDDFGGLHKNKNCVFPLSLKKYVSFLILLITIASNNKTFHYVGDIPLLCVLSSLTSQVIPIGKLNISEHSTFSILQIHSTFYHTVSTILL